MAICNSTRARAAGPDGSKTSVFGRLAILRSSMERDGAELSSLREFLQTKDDPEPDLARQLGQGVKMLGQVRDLLVPESGHTDQELPPELLLAQHDRALGRISGELANLTATLRCASAALESSEGVDQCENASAARNVIYACLANLSAIEDRLDRWSMDHRSMPLSIAGLEGAQS